MAITSAEARLWHSALGRLSSEIITVDGQGSVEDRQESAGGT
jgi:hypothetical protein